MAGGAKYDVPADGSHLGSRLSVDVGSSVARDTTQVETSASQDLALVASSASESSEPLLEAMDEFPDIVCERSCASESNWY